MTQTSRSKVREKLDALYDTLDNLGDLRDRGYPVDTGQIVALKEKIRMLEDCI